ncbi:alpha/beta hydrolase [Streptomyces sp. AB3(2024)]|uniref:alpha/beta hydrolase n=1 Tax=Streptomyces sp. AB3(2024) TaxID=3317321 RepID=UPI0035A341B0
MRTGRTTSLLAVVAAAAFLATPAPAAASAAPPQPRWQRCGASTPAALQCATLTVPLDYADPGGRKIDIAMSRLKASRPKERRGVLLLNPGGPGGPGLELPVDPAVNLGEEVRSRYDLIGFDPRGVGRSSPVSCGLTADEQDYERPYRPETFAKDVEWARTVATKCRARAGDSLRHLTTRNTARDMDAIRAALGERKISYLGFSYGTYLGAVYAQMFPRHTDRFVLDSASDPTRVWQGMFQGMAEGADAAFARWSEWTALHDREYGLGSTPAEVRRTFWDLVARADREPVDSAGAPLTGDGIRAQHARFAHVEKAAEWVAALKKAAPSAVAPATREVPPDNDASSAWAVLCGDSRTWPRDPERYRHDAVRDKALHPLYGDFASNIKPCAFWEQGSEPPTTVDNEVGALILQNEWDPGTPLAGARAMHRALHGSRMVTVAGGEGHIVNGTDPCADRALGAYLTTGVLPPRDLTCGTPATAPSNPPRTT